MSTFFWADTHFNHEGILGFTRPDGSRSRPFATVQEMNDSLRMRWNAAVLGEKDHVWILGDFAFARKDGETLDAIFWSLRGRKSLIVGNHDERNPAVLRLPWEHVEKLHTFKEGGARAELCHYPLETWKSSHSGALMLHGHSHGSLKRHLPKRFDVGVDAELGRDGPIAWDPLIKMASKENFEPTDAHGVYRS